jgi:hypothetical protein
MLVEGVNWTVGDARNGMYRCTACKKAVNERRVTIDGRRVLVAGYNPTLAIVDRRPQQKYVPQSEAEAQHLFEQALRNAERQEFIAYVDDLPDNSVVRKGWFYVKGNPAYPGVYKLGRTGNRQRRLNGYNTYDPYDNWKDVFTIFSTDCVTLENLVKAAVVPYRTLPHKKEWVRMELAALVALVHSTIAKVEAP